MREQHHQNSDTGRLHLPAAFRWRALSGYLFRSMLAMVHLNRQQGNLASCCTIGIALLAGLMIPRVVAAQRSSLGLSHVGKSQPKASSPSLRAPRPLTVQPMRGGGEASRTNVLSGVSRLESGKPGHPAPTDASASFNQLITSLVLKHLPHHYEEDKDWGKTKARWDGLEFRREGLKLETKRKTKEVNHGTWRKYSAQLLDPEDAFSVELKALQELDDHRVAFEVHCQSKLALQARQSKWVKGVQIYSLSASGHAMVRLVVSIELEILPEAKQFPPDLKFVPKATTAAIEVDEFRIDRIGKLGGEVAQQVSRAARKILDEKVSEKEKDLVSKINRQFEKHADQLKLPISEAVNSKWAELAERIK